MIDKLYIYSNFAYSIVGIYLFFTGRPVEGTALIMLGVGSYAGHKHGYWEADWAAMMATMFIFALPNYLFGLLGMCFGVFLYKHTKEAIQFVAVGVMFLLALLESANPISAFIIFALALAIRQIWHNSPFYKQTHILWHFLTAIGFVLL